MSLQLATLTLTLTLAALPLSAAEAPGVPIDVLLRLKGTNLAANPAVQTALNRALEQTRRTPQFLELVRAFNLTDQTAGLIELSAALPTESAGVEALQKVLDDGGIEAVRTALKGADGAKVLQALGSVTSDAGQALAQSMAAKPADAAPAAAGNQESLEVLLARPADAARGEKVFFGAASCSACHRIGTQGTEFGPDLTTIGDKFGKPAMYANIVDPSAGIGFGYEPWQIKLRNGSAFGLIVSETDDEIAVKAIGGVVIRHKKAEIVSRTQLPTSLMPPGLLSAIGGQEAADLLEYLVSLKKR